MKMKVIRIQKTQVSGISKTGNPYNIDNTAVTVQVPVETGDAFGFKEKTYLYGDSSNFASLAPLKDKLPADCDIELGAVLNNYGDVDTAITRISLAQNQSSVQK